MDALNQEIAAANAAGESQTDLSGRYNTTTDALTAQLMKMGMTESQARTLIGTYQEIPASKATEVTAPGAVDSTAKAQAFHDKLAALPDEERTIITALAAAGDIAAAERKLNELARDRETTIWVTTRARNSPVMGGSVASAHGNIVEAMASGGIRGLSPMAPIAQMVPPNTWRVVGDRVRDDEAYIPLDGSARSWAILAEALRRMPGTAPMADGAVVTGPQPQRAGISRIAPADIDRLASAIARMMRAQATQTVDAGMLAMSRGV